MAFYVIHISRYNEVTSTPSSTRFSSPYPFRIKPSPHVFYLARSLTHEFFDLFQDILLVDPFHQKSRSATYTGRLAR